MRHLLLLLLSFCLLSCRHTVPQERVLLTRANSIMESQPDSALQLLKSLSNPQQLSSPDNAYYCLLKTEAIDKCDLYDQEPQSDSLIKISLKYYIQNNNAEKTAYAYFYLSRCKRDRKEAQERTEALLNAVPYVMQSHNNKLQGLIYGELAAIYEYQQNALLNSANDTDHTKLGLFDLQEKGKRLFYNKLALHAFKKAKDTRNYAISLLDISNNYYQLNRFDSALYYCQQAKPILLSLHETPLLSTLYRLMAGIYLKQKDYDRAFHYIKYSMRTQDPFDYDKWYVYAQICIRTNALDTARLYLNRIVKAGYEQPEYYQLLQEIAEKQNNTKEALKYAKLTTAAKDSIILHSLAENLAGIERKYNYERIKLENKRLAIRNQRYLIFSLLTLFFLFLLTVFYMIERNREKKLVLLEKVLRSTADTKNKFFSIISHDLRNPSYSLKQLSELLYQHFDSLEKEKAAALVKLLFETAKQNHILIENLLSWATIQKGDFGIHPSVFDIREVIESTITSIRAESELKQITIKTTFQHSSRVFADRNMTATILRNLLSNAIKFSKRETQIFIETSETDTDISTRIADQGIGMTPEEVERLFHIDSKIQKEGTDGEKGSGLGLILCKEFIQKNNGKIHVQSTKNRGTLFIFALPKHTDNV